MRVNYDVRDHSRFSKWHIFLGPDYRQHSFLAMTRAEFVSNNRISGVSNRVANTDVAGVLFIAD